MVGQAVQVGVGTRRKDGIVHARCRRRAVAIGSAHALIALAPHLLADLTVTVRGTLRTPEPALVRRFGLNDTCICVLAVTVRSTRQARCLATASFAVRAFITLHLGCA
jgi:hypothetical protein